MKPDYTTILKKLDAKIDLATHNLEKKPTHDEILNFIKGQMPKHGVCKFSLTFRFKASLSNNKFIFFA